MQELRFVAVSEDGSYAVLAIPGRSGRFMLPIDDRLRAVAKGQFSRLAQYEIEVENPLRPKEIQARIRAGETVEEIADAAGIPVERVRWFEGPVLAERGYVAEQAQNASVRRQGDSTPGPRLGETVAERLTELGADPEDAQWDSRKHGDGSWQVQLTFRAGGRLHIAEWMFDPRRRHVAPADDNAARLSLPDSEMPAPAGGSLGAATVTPIRRPDRPSYPPQRPAPGPAAPATASSPEPPSEPDEEADDLPAQVAAQAASRSAPTAPVPPRAPMRTPPAAEPPAMPRPSDLPAVERPAASRPAPERQAPERPAPAAEAPAAEPPAAAARAPEAPAPKHEPEAPAKPAPAAAEQRPAEAAPARGRAKKAGQRGRRSSVPSWDEIMLGNSRQPD
ncbi:MAG TPA: septation protein SepH [Streptosporangiaceae bacterium]